MLLAGWYLDERWCPFCKKDTQQECRDDGHERDSTHDAADCTVCGASYNGYNGHYELGNERRRY